MTPLYVGFFVSIVRNSLVGYNSGFWRENMFEVTDESGNTFVFDTWEEISQFFSECVWAVGAVDAEIKVKFHNPMND